MRRLLLALGALLLSSGAQAQNVPATCSTPNYYSGLFHPGCLAAADLNNNNTAIAASITATGALYVPKTGGTMTGALNGTTATYTGFLFAATPGVGTNSSTVATTNFVATSFAPKASPSFTGVPLAPTATVGTNTNQIATTAFVSQYIIAGFAPIDSPAFTGVPTAPTAAADTDTTQLSTTAFVLGQASDVLPLMDGSAAIGTSLRYARADHVHPTDTTRAAQNNANLTGIPTAPTASPGTSTTQLATTQFVATTYAPLASPALTGVPTAPTATLGTSTIQLATTAFVAGGFAPIAAPHFTGNAIFDADVNVVGTLSAGTGFFTTGIGASPISAARSLSDDTNTFRTLALRGRDRLNVKDMGALGTAMTFSGAVMAASSTTVAIAGASFSSADITTPRKVIQIDGALGNAQAPLVTTIEAVTNGTTIVVGSPSTHKTPAQYAGLPSVVTPGVTGTVTPGDTYTLVGGVVGTGGAATVATSSTRVYGPVTVGAAGTGVNANVCVVQTLPGSGSPARISFATTGVGGGLTGAGTIISGGHFFTNPANLGLVDVVGYNTCVITGAKIAVTMGADVVIPVAVGDYDTLPTAARSLTSITQTAGLATATTSAPHGFINPSTILLTIAGGTSGSTAYNGSVTATVTGASTFTYAVSSGAPSPATGTLTYARPDIALDCLVCTTANTGATASMIWNTTGTGIYGTDDSPAIASAVTKMVSDGVAGKKTTLYFPGGNYLIKGTALPICNAVPCAFVGDAQMRSILTVASGYPSPYLIGSRNAWVGPDGPPVGATLTSNQLSAGLVVSRLTVVGDSYAPSRVNAIQLFDRNDLALIEYFDAFYVGSCIRSGEQFTPGTGNAVTRESRIFQVRCFQSGSSTQPGVLLTAQGPTTGGSDVRTAELEILGSRGDGFVIQNEATVSAMRNMFVNGLRIEGTARKALDNQGDLWRIGIATNHGATVQKVYATNVFLSNPYANYCALRFSGNIDAYPNLISVINAGQVSGSNGGNGVCVDAGDDINLDFNSLDAYGYEVTTGDAFANAGAVGTRNIFNLHGRDSLYLWSLGAGVSVLTPPLVSGNPGLKTNYQSQAQATNFTGGFQVAGSVPTLPYGLLAKITGVDMNTTADTQIPLALGSATKYAFGATTTPASTVIARLTNCTGAASTAAGGIYTQASKAGVVLTPTTAFSTLSGVATDMQNLAGIGGAINRTWSTTPLFFSLTTPQGSATTCDLYVYGNPIP